MRFAATFKLEKEQIPQNYRPIFLSFLKNALTHYQNGALYDTYYGSPKEKPFTFSISFSPCRFADEEIILPDKLLRFHFSTSDALTGIHFYNALLLQKGISFALPLENAMTLTSFYMEADEVISHHKLEVNFTAPLCVRLHNRESNKDTYLTYQDENFHGELLGILTYQLQAIPELARKLSTFSITPVQSKTVMVKHYEHSIPCSLGRFSLEGDIHLLTHLYLSGLGSRKSSGFGYFNILKQGGDS